jgi:adenosylhomocysteine nucleosidase
MKSKIKSKILNERREVGTLVCFALEQEAVPFRRLAVKMPDVRILITGIGARNAGTSVRRFLEQHLTRQVFTCGFCGGLDPDLENGDVVFMTGYPALEKRLAEADTTLATFHSAPRIATTAAEKKQLRTKTGADVVEMESEAIMEVCREKKIPCAMVRAISDTAGEDLPLDFNALSRPDLSLHQGKLTLAIAKAPWKIIALMRLHRRTSFAAQQLANALAKVIW